MFFIGHPSVCLTVNLSVCPTFSECADAGDVDLLTLFRRDRLMIFASEFGAVFHHMPPAKSTTMDY